jgi:hypothetical protein
MKKSLYLKLKIGDLAMENKNEEEEEDINALLVEYTQCFSNYIYRDQLAAHEFYLALVITVALVGILETLGEKMGNAGIIVMLIIGFFALHILHIDLMSTSSCKKAAISRALEIEKQLSKSKTPLQLARKIGNRKEYFLENKLKMSIPSAYLMIWFVRILIGIWLIYCVWTLLQFPTA